MPQGSEGEEELEELAFDVICSRTLALYSKCPLCSVARMELHVVVLGMGALSAAWIVRVLRWQVHLASGASSPRGS